jgi:hypothetical protein
MKIGDVVKIKDIDANHPRDVGKIGIVIRIDKPVMDRNSGVVCVMQTPTERLRYNERRLELIND